jgi:solute carrier family 38 (sodium-coupled neutral amino acid transporter), member 2
MPRGGGGGQPGEQQQQREPQREPLLPTTTATRRGGGNGLGAAVVDPRPPASPPPPMGDSDANYEELLDDERVLVPATASDGSVVYTRQRVRAYAASEATAAAASPQLHPPPQDDTFWPCTFNIAKVLMGAGMMALPRAFALLGWVCGGLMLLAVGLLTFTTLCGMVAATEQARPAARSYGALVRRLLGPRAEAVLGVAIVGNCFVLNIVFLVIMGDILVGSKQQQQQGGGGGGGGEDGGGAALSAAAGIGGGAGAGAGAAPPPHQLSAAAASGGGLIGELTGITSGPLADRRVVLAAVAGLALFPLARARSMERMRMVNVAGMMSNGLFAALMIVLGVRVAVLGHRGGGEGKGAATIPAWPQWAALAGASSSSSSSSSHFSPLLAGLGFAAVAPVLLNADVCHQSVLPLVPLLRPYSPKRMCGVLGTALLGCNVLYAAIALGGVAAFGTGVDADVLSEVTAASLARLLGGGDGGGAATTVGGGAPTTATTHHVAVLAAALALAVRVGYLLSLTGSYVLLTYPLRETIGEAVLGGHEQTAKHWTPVTAALVAASYAVACFLPSIWSALSLVGSATCTVMAFAVPGLLMLATRRAAKRRRAQERAEAVAAAAADGAGAMAAALLGAEAMDERLVAREGGVRRRRAREGLELAGAWTAVVLGVLLFVNGFVVQLFVPSSGGVDR